LLERGVGFLPNEQDIPNEFGIGLGIEGGGMAFEVTTLASSNPNYPAALRSKKVRDQFPRISIIGDPEILKSQMLGLFCSVKCPGDLILALRPAPAQDFRNFTSTTCDTHFAPT
jgi:hypothetical protein